MVESDLLRTLRAVPLRSHRKAVVFGLITSSAVGALAFVSWRHMRRKKSKADAAAHQHVTNTTTQPDPPPEFLCPITKELMECPVFTSDGHTYERDAIAQWLENHATSPRTGLALADKVLRPNYALRAQIDDFRQRTGLPPLSPWKPVAQERVTPAAAGNATGAAAARQLTPEAVRGGLASVLRIAPDLLVQMKQALSLPLDRSPSEVALAVIGRADLSQKMQVLIHAHPRLQQAFRDGASRAVFAGPVPPLVEAVKSGDVAGTVRLLSEANGVLPTTAEARTLLHLAARSGKEQMVLLLLDRGLQVNSADVSRVTPLHIACEHGHLGCVRVLLDRHAFISARAIGGATPLHLGATGGKVEVVHLLLQRGADASCQREDGATPLHLAAYFGHLPVCEELVAAAEDTVRTQDLLGATAVHAAAAGSRPEVLKFLIDHGGDVHATLRSGESALHKAVTSPACVRVLLAAGCAPNVLREDGSTPLHFAALQDGGGESVRLLLDAGADPSVSNKERFTPLHTAVWAQRKDAARLLIARGGPLEAKSNNSSTPLHFACWHGLEDIVTALLAAGSNVFATTADGDTPLHQATYRGHRTCVTKLLESLQNPEDQQRLLHARKRDGSTALHLAAAQGLEGMVALLLERGADPRAANQGGVTPLDLAQQYGHVAVMHTLQTFLEQLDNEESAGSR